MKTKRKNEHSTARQARCADAFSNELSTSSSADAIGIGRVCVPIGRGRKWNDSFQPLCDFASLRLCVEFANSSSDDASAVAVFSNGVNVAEDGWAQLAPFGDYAGRAIVRRDDGAFQTFDAIQRLDREAAEGMVAKFKSPWNRLKRYFTGCTIYAGHPDVPALAAEYPDKSPKGMIVDLQVRDQGLFCKPVFTNEGSELVETRTLRAFSAYWSAKEIGAPSAPGALRLFRPDCLKSAGLTNHPNLPVHLLNESKTQNPDPNIVKKQIVIDFLATQGITLANEAADEQIADALLQLGRRAAEIETLRADLVNERQFHRETLLDQAIAAGRITAAQRPDWAARLETDFANGAIALGQLLPVLKTKAVTAQLGARKAEMANPGERRDALETLLRAELAANGGDYNRAFATVQKANPALFQAMKQPVQ